MSEATTCDRCGTFVERPVNSCPLIEYSPSILHGRRKVSLCSECYGHFIDFLEGLGRYEDDLSIQNRDEV